MECLVSAEILPALIIGIESSSQSQDEEQRGAMSRGDDGTLLLREEEIQLNPAHQLATTTVISSQVCTVHTAMSLLSW